MIYNRSFDSTRGLVKRHYDFSRIIQLNNYFVYDNNESWNEAITPSFVDVRYEVQLKSYPDAEIDSWALLLTTNITFS